jgi:hypothetical protein
MSAYRVILAAIPISAAWGKCHLWSQENPGVPVLHIRHSVTTSKTGFPQSLYMYHVLEGAKSPAEARALEVSVSWVYEHTRARLRVSRQTINAIGIFVTQPKGIAPWRSNDVESGKGCDVVPYSLDRC